MRCVSPRRFISAGINIQPIIFPAVEDRASRLRFFLTCLHTEGQVASTVDVVAEELMRLGGRPRSAPAMKRKVGVIRGIDGARRRFFEGQERRPDRRLERYRPGPCGRPWRAQGANLLLIGRRQAQLDDTIALVVESTRARSRRQTWETRAVDVSHREAIQSALRSHDDKTPGGHSH